MAKTFAMLVGWVLVIVGVLNFFVTPIELLPAHGIFHVIAGALGVWAAKGHAIGYALWVGIIGIILAAIGFFFGAPTLFGYIDLPNWISVTHAVLGIWGLWTYSAASKRPTNTIGTTSPTSAM